MESHGPSATRVACFARDLLRSEGLAAGDVESVAPACHAVVTRLFEKLRPLVGTGGFETLLGRATVMAAREHPQLGGLPVPRSGPPPMDELKEALESPGGSGAAAAAALLEEFLAFMGRLVGWRLTLVLLRDHWPEAVSRFGDPDRDPSSTSNPSRSEG